MEDLNRLGANPVAAVEVHRLDHHVTHGRQRGGVGPGAQARELGNFGAGVVTGRASW
jgi:hypothetical protein